MYKYYSYLIISIFLLSSCGGGGGGGSTPDPVTPAPVISFSASPTSVPISSFVTLSWSSSNASSCSASGSWQGSKGVSGSENIVISNIGNNDFSLSCSGSGGTSSKSLTVVGFRETQGVTVDGYIRGADIFIDTNENFVADSNEFSTTSDNDGTFNIRYDDGILISLNGFDVDTNTSLENFLITHKMDGYSEFKVISPITTLLQFFSNPSNVKPSLGIDNSLDISTFDPVANKSSSAINDYLYEKGNQLTVLAYTLQNLSNNLTNSTETTQDFFSAIAEELESSYNSTQQIVDIESKDFITNALNNVINSKGLNNTISNAENISDSLANMSPIIKVYSENSVTNAVFNFSISTLQTDISSMSDGTASADLINKYVNDIYNYIADDQNIDVNKIKPNSVPLITTDLSSLVIDENEFNVGIIEAVDEDGDEIFFSITGTDASLLDISNAGALSFNLSPDFEVPSDSDGDNNYSFNISVTDNASASFLGYDISSSSEDNANIAVQNIDEDLIFFNLSSVDGTETENPKLNIAMQIDSLTQAEEAQVLIEYPEADDPNSTIYRNGFQVWLYSGINTNDGINWSISEELPSYALSGNYKVRKLKLTRGNLDDLEISAEVINTKGFETYVALENTRQDNVKPALQSISNFTITGNDGDDSTNILVTFDANIVEQNLKEVRVFLRYPGGAERDTVGTINDDGSVTFVITLDPNAASGDYLIERFIITDLAGNSITYSNQDLVNGGLNNRWTLDNDISDDQAPKILSLSLNPILDSTDFSRKNIQVKVTTDAQQSPIDRIFIRLTNEDGITQIDEDFPTEQFVLTAAEYVHTFALPFEYPAGTYNVDYIFIKDRAENINNYPAATIKNNSWDNKVVFEGKNRFVGKVIDGYISGAEVFIDQNFNFNKDPGELSTVSQENGSFLIGTDDDDLYQCLQNRPIVASVPVGATDASLGEVATAFRMILPSISDAGGNNSIVITPFTDLLSQAIINAKGNSSITEDLTVAEGCGGTGDSIASSVTNEINQIVETIQSSFGVSLSDLVSDYISGNSNSIINETKAQRIGSFLPYFKLIQDQIDADLTAKYNKNIYTNLTLEDESINTILSDDNFELLPLDFFTVYKTEPNSSGWFTEESIRAWGARLSINGEVKHYKCITEPENCVTTDYTTSKLGDASEDYKNMTYFLNPSYSTTDNVSFFIEDNRRWSTQTRDGVLVREKDCVFGEQLQISPKNRGNLDAWTSMASDATNYDIQVDTCEGLADGTKNLFTQKNTSYETSSVYESTVMQYVNSNWDNAQYLQNKIKDPYTNRENFDLDAVVSELKGLPYKYKDLNKARAYANDAAGDRVYLQLTIRDVATSNATENHSISIRENPDDDEYSKLELNSEGALIETVKSTGQQARDDLFNAYKNSVGYNNEDFIGTESVTDNRVSIQGKTIDGYISGANVFVDVNFNQRKDAGEYSAITDSNGVFDLLVDQNDLACINARPIVADVPVGAIDSTLGEVTEAYQMILPSKDDAGSNAIVISPFTSLLTEAILKGKDEADLSEDLTVAEGCEAAGDAVAEKISTQVSSLLSDIESTFAITWSSLISDFIAEDTNSGNITEEIAQKVAAFFPYYKKIKDDIAGELSSRYAKDVTPNVSLSKDSLNAILSQGQFTELPLEFFSVYKTNPNAQGFYNIDEITSTGATVSSDGSLKRYLCTLSVSADCTISGLSLNGVANASKYYNRQVNINNDNFSVDGVVGNINIRGRDSRGVRNEDSSPESYCESEETIQFVGPQDSKGLQMEYRYGFGRGVNNLKDCALLPNYGPSISLRIEKQGRGVNFPDTAPTWAIQFGVNNQGTTRLTESKIYNIIDNDDLDPAALIKEVALIPAALAKIDEMRKLLSYGEGAYYYYSPNTSPDYDSGEKFKTYNYRVSSVPRDDQFQSMEYHPDTGNVDGPTLEGQEARDAIFNIMSGSAYDYDNFIGNSAPRSNILFEYEGANGAIFEDRLIQGKDRDYRVFPRLNIAQDWIDASLIGSQISKASMDAFINGDYTTQTKFNFGLNVDAPFTSVQDFNVKIYSNNQYSTSTEYLELNMQLKIETLSSGAIQVTWLDQGKVTFKIVDGDTVISKEVTNQRGDISKSIPKGNYNFDDFDFFKSLLDKVRDQFSSSELQVLKDFFKNNGLYSFKIDLGNYAILDDYDQISSIIAGTFGVSDNPVNSVYSYYLPIIFGEGQNTEICFNSAWVAESDITFDIQPIYRNKPGFMKADEASFSSTNVTIAAGSQQECVTFSSPVDDELQERQEFIEFEIVNISGAVVGRNIPTRLTVQDD